MSSKKPKPMLGVFGANKDAHQMLAALNSTTTAETSHNSNIKNSAHEHLDPDSSVNTLAPGQFVKLPVAKLKRSPFNARVFYSQDEIDETADSIRLSGQEVPAIGYVEGDFVVIMDGGKRLNACIAGNISTLDVKIIERPHNASEEYLRSREVNVRRSMQTCFDDAVRWRELLDKGVFSTAESLGQAIKSNESTVSKTLALNKIPHVLQRMMTDHAQTSALTIAYEVSQLFGAGQDADELEQAEKLAEEIIQQIQKCDLSRSQVIDLIKSKKAAKKYRVRGETTPVTFMGNKGHIKVTPQRGEIELKIKGLDENSLANLREQIQSILKHGAN